MTPAADRFAPAISIVIPVYNGADFLAQAIDSALAQTYPDVEVIVVDDGSDDGGATQRIAESYGDRIRYIQRPNGGCGAALNTGIAAMSGEYFSWLSHDDVYPPDKLATQVAILAGLSDRETIIYGDYDQIDASSRFLRAQRQLAWGTAAQLGTPLYALTHGMIHGCTLLIHRRHFDRRGLFDPALRGTQDADLWFRMFRHARLRYEPHVFVLSRVHDRQGSRTLPSMRAECIALWTRFIEEVTPEEAIGMQGSHYRFRDDMAKFVAAAFPEMEARARERAEAVLTETPVTAVVPFRNRIAWTLEALASARAQSHGALEIILVDDGSTDDVAPVVAAAAADPRVRYLRQRHGGAAAARNRGVAEARGRYVAFLDSDDRWMPDKVARQLAFLERSGLAWAHTAYVRTGGGAEAVPAAAGHFAGRVYPRIVSYCPVTTSTVMARTDVLRAHPFPPGVFPGEDVIAWIGLAREHDLGAIDEPLTMFRVTGETTALSPAKSRDGLANVLAALVAEPDPEAADELAALAADLRARDAALARDDPLAARILLLRRGLRSLRRQGLRATWRRFRLWQASRV